jgi:hypothetical protein
LSFDAVNHGQVFDRNSGEILLLVDADPKECQGAAKPSDEPYADCVKRIKGRVLETQC